MTFLACPPESPPPTFVLVTDITGVPTTATAGIPLTLTGTVTPDNATNQTIIWSVRNAGDTGAVISGNTLNTTAGGTVTVTATIANGLAGGKPYTHDFPITVLPLGDVDFLITFLQIIDAAPIIAGPTLYLTSNNGPTSATLVVDNPNRYDSISWQVGNTNATGTGNSFTLSADNPAYNSFGEHFVTVLVMAGGVPYSKTVPFRIAH